MKITQVNAIKCNALNLNTKQQMSKNPKKLILNPIHNTFNKIPMRYIDYPYLDFFNEIKWTRKLVPIEIISKYGVFGWSYFLLLIWLFIKLFIEDKISKTDLNKFLILFLSVLPFLWLMPASYLFLDTHKLLLPFILLFLLDKQDQTKKKKNTKHLKEN